MTLWTPLAVTERVFAGRLGGIDDPRAAGTAGGQATTYVGGSDMVKCTRRVKVGAR